MTHDDVLVDPADSTKLLTGRWSELLRRVDVLIARAGITYVQLLDLLVTEFVNPPLAGGLRRVTIQSIDESDPASCDLSKLRLTGSVVAGEAPRVLAHLPAHPVEGDIGAPGDLLDRLLRFLRLQRRTRWTTRELDTAIGRVHPGRSRRDDALVARRAEVDQGCAAPEPRGCLRPFRQGRHDAVCRPWCGRGSPRFLRSTNCCSGIAASRIRSTLTSR